jgi:hypothetical protein
VGFEPTVDQTAHNGFRACAVELEIAGVERSQPLEGTCEGTKPQRDSQRVELRPKPGWDETSARSRADVCPGATREELIQHVAGPLELTWQRVRVAAKGDRRRTRLTVRRPVAHDLRSELGLTPAWSSQVAAVCRASWSPIG